MATISKRTLSGSDDGRGIKVTTVLPVDGSDTTIHTSINNATDTDLITLFAYNDSSTAAELELGWGGTTNVDDSIAQTIAPRAGLVPVTVKLPLRDSQVVVASASVANVIVIFGWVDRIDA